MELELDDLEAESAENDAAEYSTPFFAGDGTLAGC